MEIFSLGKPITIGGEEVVVVRDVVGHVPIGKDADTYSMVEQKGADGRPPIYVSENDLARLRNDYPGIKVYGLWQIMFHNNAVRFGSQVITFPLDEANGLYLLMEGISDYHSPSNISKTGEYLNGVIFDNFEAELSKAYVINVDIRSLKLPQQPAYTLIELSDKKKAENKRRWIVVGSLCSLIIVVGLAVNYGLQTIYKSRMADYTTKRSLINELDGRVKTLLSERLVERPNDSIMLSQLFRLFEQFPRVKTPAVTDEVKVGFVGAHIFVTQAKASVDPSSVISGLKTELLP
ncbi:hypothetical protein, partial [Pseudomonas syringae]